MNKKLVTILLSGVLTLGLYGCSNTSDDENANTKDKTKVEETKSNGKETLLSSGHFIAGEDFEPGIYTIIAIKGNGNVSSSNMYDSGINAIMAANADELNSNIGSEMYQLEYKNIKLPEGTELSIDGLTVQLVPKGQEPSNLEDISSESEDQDKEEIESSSDSTELNNSMDKPSSNSNSDNSNKSDSSSPRKYCCSSCGKEITKKEKESTGRCNSCQEKRDKSSSSVNDNLEGDRNGDGILNHLDDYDDSDYGEYDDNSNNNNNDNNISPSSDSDDTSIPDSEGGTAIYNN